MMFVDPTGALGHEHARDLRRTAARQSTHRSALHTVRDFVARAQLGPVQNYRSR
jgi:hypothetical protein